MMWGIFSCCNIMMYVWWATNMNSLALLSLLLFTIGEILHISITISSILGSHSLPLYMMILAFGGGLFILISFVILSHPNDSQTGSGVNIHQAIFFSFLFIYLSNFFKESLMTHHHSTMCYSKVCEESSNVVLCSYVTVYLFLIFMLFILLFPINHILNFKTGAIFSWKSKKF